MLCEWCLVGVRRFLENSTACQKSMPNLPRLRGASGLIAVAFVVLWPLWLWWLVWCVSWVIPLVEMDGLFTRLFVDAKIRPSLGGSFFCDVRLPVCVGGRV